MPTDGGRGPDVLDALAEAVLMRLEETLAARVESLTAPATEPPEPVWLRVSQVARQVGASERTVYRALRSGALRGKRLGAHWRIRPESVEAWLADPRPPRSAGVARAAGPAAGRRTAAAAPENTFMKRARSRQRSDGSSARPATGRRDAAPPKEEP